MCAFSNVKIMDFALETLGSLWHKHGYAPCDGLRSLAMLWVCWFHAVSHFLNSTGGIGVRVYSSWWPVALPVSGDLGVELFLVLSGFLLGGTLFRNITGSGTISWWKFYFQRWVRITPAYASTLLVSSLINLPAGSHVGCRRFWWAHLLFLNNYFPFWESFPQPGHKHLPMCCIHTWSVAVEVQLYFITPPLFACAIRLSSAFPKLSRAWASMAICFCGWCLCCLLRLVSMVSSEDYRVPYPNTLYRMAPYFAGVGAGVVVCLEELGQSVLGELGGWAQRALVLAAIITLTVAAVLGGEPGYLIENSGFGLEYGQRLPSVARLHAALLRPLASLAVAYLLVLTLTGHAPRLNRLLSWSIWHPLAGLSYSMYLLQYAGSSLFMFPLLRVFLTYVHNPGLVLSTVVAHLLALGAILGTLPLALLNYALVERPCMLAGKRCVAAVASKQEPRRLPCSRQLQWPDDLSSLRMLVRREAQAIPDLTDAFPFGMWSMFPRRSD